MCRDITLPGSSRSRLNNAVPTEFLQRYMAIRDMIADLIWRLWIAGNAQCDIRHVRDAFMITFTHVTDFSCIISCHCLTSTWYYSKWRSIVRIWSVWQQEGTAYIYTWCLRFPSHFVSTDSLNNFKSIFFPYGKRRYCVLFKENINSLIYSANLYEKKYEKNPCDTVYITHRPYE